MKIAIVFLTITPTDELKRFAKECSKSFDTYIIADDETCKEEDNVYLVTDAECIANNYINSNVADASHIRKNPMAWDKVLYLFCKIKTEYDFVWILEDDVFVKDLNSIKMIQRYNRHFDLIVPNNNFKNDKTPDWHWKTIFDKIEPPYFYSMVCACGMSRNMLSCIDKYVVERKELFYIEAMFNTLAMQNKLDVYSPLELITIVWQGEWGLDEIIQLPNNFFHPVKTSHEELREIVKKAQKDGYKSTKMLPEFVRKRFFSR